MRKILLNDAINEAKQILIDSNYAYPDNFIKSILEIVIKDRKTDFFNYFEYSNFLHLIKRKANGEPLEKILKIFEYNCGKFLYSDSVLTPRQETELLIDMIEKENDNNLKVLDMCSGSGCIGICLAINKKYDVTLCDISKKAIKNSKKNAKLNGAKLKIIKSDLFEKIKGNFDIIVSNPPYIKSKCLDGLEKEVKNFDPNLALDGGDDGMFFYRKIIKEAPNFLKPNGKIYLEIDNDLEDEIEMLLNEKFEEIRILKDYSGNYRFAIAKKRS